MTTPHPRIHPERKKRVQLALRIFSFFAWLTGIMLLLLCVAMVLKYGFPNIDADNLTFTIAQIHGWIYLAFFVASLNLGLKARWSPQKWLITALCGVVPLLSFFAEHWRRKEVVERFELDRP